MWTSTKKGRPVAVAGKSGARRNFIRGRAAPTILIRLAWVSSGHATVICLFTR
jgi:hypothetical protein